MCPGKDCPAYDWVALKYWKMKSHLVSNSFFRSLSVWYPPRRADHPKCLWHFSSYSLIGLKGYPWSQGPAPAPAGTVPSSISLLSPSHSHPTGPLSQAEVLGRFYFSQTSRHARMGLHPLFLMSLLPNCLRRFSSQPGLFYRSNRDLS